MPENDQIFDRLRAATDAERQAIARALEVEPTATVETLSRALRKQAGNMVRNVFRKDHELRYAQILADVVVEAARKAGWPAPAIDEMAWSRWAEDYALQGRWRSPGQGPRDQGPGRRGAGRGRGRTQARARHRRCRQHRAEDRDDVCHRVRQGGGRGPGADPDPPAREGRERSSEGRIMDYQWLFTVSAKWRVLLETGQVVLNPTANRLIWTATGKFAAALVPSGGLLSAVSALPAVAKTVAEAVKLAPALMNIGPALQALQVVSAIGAVASVANLAVSIAGFALVLKRLDRLDHKLDAMLVTLRDDLRDLAAQLDDLSMTQLLAGRDSLERALAATTEEERAISARSARDRFQHVRMSCLAVWKRTTPWLNPKMSVAAVRELQERYVVAAIGELQATFILGDSGAFTHVARSSAADVRVVMALSPIDALRARTAPTDAMLRDLPAYAAEVRELPVLAADLGAAAAATVANAERLAAFEDDAELPALLDMPGHELLRAMRDAPGVEIYAFGLERAA
ncbi:MAG: hypothetical protein R3B06_03815 [Kofleriaceae bacterium]